MSDTPAPLAISASILSALPTLRSYPYPIYLPLPFNNNDDHDNNNSNNNNNNNNTTTIIKGLPFYRAAGILKAQQSLFITLVEQRSLAIIFYHFNSPCLSKIFHLNLTDRGRLSPVNIFSTPCQLS
jgi:hypothetical protein